MPQDSAAVTELPLSPEQERRSRFIKYMVAMTIRVVCVFLCLVTPGWWLLIPATGAIVLPYFAVIIANEAGSRRRTVLRPGALVPRLRRDDAA